MNQFVIVTGAAGYIGGITAIKLHEAGYRVIGIDRFECPGRLTEYFHKFEVGNFDSDESLMLIRQHRPVAIIHCAGSSLVGPSLKNPSQYYENNFDRQTDYEEVIRESQEGDVIFLDENGEEVALFDCVKDN